MGPATSPFFIAVVMTRATALPGPARAACILPDTDQSLCFDTLAVIDEPVPEEPFYGQEPSFQSFSRRTWTTGTARYGPDHGADVAAV